MRELRNIKSPSFLKELTFKELNELSNTIRSFLIEELSTTGGHLGANLGVVELTIALHYVFNSPKDKLIWDVGHQAYVHKILTGQASEFPTLRKHKGLSGFQTRMETEHDIWGAGHSSTSLSAAVGLAVARDLKTENYDVVPIIGDGALTGGMAFEALNHLGDLQKNVKIVLNDNGMSISKNVGALHKILNTARENSETNKAKEYFELLGIHYLGPVDGHCIHSLIHTFEEAIKIKSPVLIHVITQKGKGFLPAELDQVSHYHGIGPFEKTSGELLDDSKSRTWSEVVSDELVKLAKKQDDFIVLTPAMILGSKLEKFADSFPERIFDTAIAEQHTVTLAGGASIAGIKPVIAIYSTFLQRAYDQIIHDICRQNIPVFFCIDRAGLVGADGDTHHGLFDIGFLRNVPNLIIMMPSTMEQCIEMVQFGLNYKDGPIALRFPRGEQIKEEQLVTDTNNYIEENDIKDFTWRILKEGQDLAFLTFGPLVQISLQAARELSRNYNIEVLVIDVRFIKPLDTHLMDRLIKRKIPILTIEEAVLAGGFGSAVLEYISDSNMLNEHIVKRIGIEDEFIEHGSISCLRKVTKLTKNHIVKQAITIMNKKVE